MPKTAFYGDLSTTDLEAVRSNLECWLGSADLNVKAKLSGDQIVYEDEHTYLYCYRAHGLGTFQFEGNFATGMDEARQRLESLIETCRANDVVCSCDYVALDDAGDQTGPEHHLE